MGWKALVRSSPGVSHHKHNIPCQDSGGYICFEDILIGAVSDGAGSARLSDQGSKLAVTDALISLRKHLENLKQTKPNLCLDSQEARDIFSLTLKNVVRNLDEVAREQNSKLSEFACTLLLFIAAPDWIAAMQIGDGFIVVKPSRTDYQLLFKPDKGEFANQTTFITSINAEQDMQVALMSNQRLEFVCASTDGLERLAISFSNWQPSAAFFQPFEHYLKTTPQTEFKKEGGWVQEFLDSERVNGRTDDDKALLLCLYNTNLPLDKSYELPIFALAPKSKKELPKSTNNTGYHDSDLSNLSFPLVKAHTPPASKPIKKTPGLIIRAVNNIEDNSSRSLIDKLAFAGYFILGLTLLSTLGLLILKIKQLQPIKDKNDEPCHIQDIKKDYKQMKTDDKILFELLEKTVKKEEYKQINDYLNFELLKQLFNNNFDSFIVIKECHSNSFIALASYKNREYYIYFCIINATDTDKKKKLKLLMIHWAGIKPSLTDKMKSM